MWIITTNKHHAREGVPSNLHVGWSGSSTGAGAAVWEGTRLSGGAEDASAAAAGGAEAGADLQAHSSQRRGKITQNSLRNTSGPNIVVGCAHQWWISFCCFCVISQFAPVCESTLHEKQPLHSKFVSSLIISDSNAKQHLIIWKMQQKTSSAHISVWMMRARAALLKKEIPKYPQRSPFFF